MEIQKLTELNLKDNNITDQGVVHLCGALKDGNSKLTENDALKDINCKLRELNFSRIKLIMITIMITIMIMIMIMIMIIIMIIIIIIIIIRLL